MHLLPNGSGGHIILFGLLNQLLTIGLPIKQRVLGMAVRVLNLHGYVGASAGLVLVFWTIKFNTPNEVKIFFVEGE